MDGMMNDESGASAPAGLAGYFYQVDVSIYFALDLMLAQKRLDQVTLEPANHEDLAADLEDETRVSAATQVTVDGYGLVVQAKLRNTEPWGVSDLKTLIARDDDDPKTAGARKRRKSPAKLLQDDTKLRYLLVTSIGLKGEARGIGVRRLGDWSSTLPDGLIAKAPAGAGRIAVLDQLDEQKLEGLIRELLLVTCKVPRVNLDACLDALRNIALGHMRNGPSDWSRADLEGTIAEHEGYLASRPEIGTFVEPTNWDDLLGALDARNAVIITGATGTGKTLAAEVLLDHLKTKVDGGFKVVRVSHGPQQVWAWREPGPVVFMIEDPWGKYRFHPEQLPWNADLDQMLQGARKDRRFIVTTRSDVLVEATRLSAKWFVRLETRHYGQRERVRLFENRLRGLPEAVQRAAHTERSLVLERLESPYEIQKFFDGLREGLAPGEFGPELVRRCIALAHTDAIEATIVEQVTDRGDNLPAAAVWGLLKARPSLSWSALSTVALALGDLDRDVEDKIEPLVRFMAAGRNLRQPNDAISYYHPRVEAGLEQVLRKQASRSARLLGSLLEVLLDLDTRLGEDWGHESAAQLVAGARRDNVALRVSPQAQARLDAYLRQRLLTPGGDIDRDLDLAGVVGTLGDAVADLARWLTARGKVFGHLDHWRDTRLAKAEVERIAADPDVAAVAARFVREYLPATRDRFDAPFFKKLKVLAGPLTEAYRDAALAMVGDGRTWNARLVAQDALVDFDGFEPVLDAAVADYRKLASRHDDSFWLEFRNGEHSEAYAQHLAEQHHEDGDTDEIYFRLYVETLRGRGGWAAILSHRHRDTLILPWIELLDTDGVATLAGEMEGLAKACHGTDQEARFWDLVADRWAPELATHLGQRLQDADAPESVRQAILEVMARHDPARGRQALADMVTGGDLVGVLRWMIDLKAVSKHYRVSDAAAAFIAAAPGLAGPFATLAGLVLAGAVGPLDAEDVARLKALDAAALPNLQLVKAQLLTASGRPVRSLVESLLEGAGDEQADIDRTVAALSLAIDQGCWDLVEAGLGHRFADVRRDALLAIAPRSTQPLAQPILDLAADKGSGVRRALVAVLRDRPDLGHQPALLLLIHDTWSDGEFYFGDEVDYPIACRAADLLTEQAPLDAGAADAVLKVANNTADPELRWTLMLALARRAGDAGLDRLTDLAVEVGRPEIHAAAASALYVAGGMGDQRARRFNRGHLLRRPPKVAVNMALAVGASGALEPTLVLAKALVGDADRKALVFPLLFSAIGRDDDLADRLSPLLPGGLISDLEALVAGGGPIPRSRLDDLGDFRVRDAVLDRLSNLFKKKPVTPLPSRPLNKR